MREITTSKKRKITFFADIKELTAERENEINKLSLIEIGVGSNMEAVGAHLQNLFDFLGAQKIQEATKEAINLHNNYYMMIEGLSTDSLMLALFLQKIDDKYYNDLSEEGLKETSKALVKTGITHGEASEILDSLKKKLLATFNRSFLIDSVNIDELIRSNN